MGYKIESIQLVRQGTSDDVNVTARIDETEVTIHVWYSHLYGTNEGSLAGNKQAIAKYIRDTLIETYEQSRPQPIEL